MSGAGLGLDRDSSVCLGEREGGISVTQLPLQKSGGFDLVAMAVMTSLFPLMVLDTGILQIKRLSETVRALVSHSMTGSSENNKRDQVTYKGRHTRLMPDLNGSFESPWFYKY